MKKTVRARIAPAAIIALIAIIGFVTVGCSQPIGQPYNTVPVEEDFDISDLSAPFDGSPKEVSITPKAGKSYGSITVYYTGIDGTEYGKSTTPPSDIGKYAVTFDVSGIVGYKAATGLIAGTLWIIEESDDDADPIEEDFDISGHSAIYDGEPKAVIITPKADKSQGTITVYYGGDTAEPSDVGSYVVTFNVAAAEGFKAAAGLIAGTLTISEQSADAVDPIKEDFDIEGLSAIYDGQHKEVSITPKAGKSEGAITVYYTGIDGTVYAKSTTPPLTAGKYAVTFDVAAALGYKKAADLDAGTLVIIPGPYTITFNKNGGETEANPKTVMVSSPATTVENLPEPPTRTGYTFAGWSTSSGSTGTPFDTTTTVTGNRTVYAKWNLNILTINYAPGEEGEGQGPASPAAANYGTRVTIPENTYTHILGGTFTGWKLSDSDTIYQVGDNPTVASLSPVIAAGNASITLTATWKYAPSSNANIRAVSGEGTNKLYGLYMAGMPGVSNGEPRATAEGFTDTTDTIIVNYTLARIERSIVVIVEDEKVSKVEFGKNAGADSVSSTPPSSWTTLTKNDDYSTPDTVGKRWVGSVSGTPDGTKTGFYVRITAQDGTQQVYRYVQHYSTSSSDGAYRGELNTLTIGGKSVISGGSVQSGQSKGTFAGSWNKTVAPNFEPGQVTVFSADSNLTLNAVFTNGDGQSVQWAKVSAAGWPLKENSAVTFSEVTSGMTLNTTVSDVKNGDYIIIRMNSKENTYASLNTHYIIKVNVQFPYTLSINYAGGGGTGSAPASPTSAALGTNITMPANTYSYSGKYFVAWEVSGTGSIAGTYFAGASAAVSDLSTAIADGNASITLTAAWTDRNPSKNANIRAVSGEGTNKLYGLYMAGIPGVSNGEPKATAEGFTNTNETLMVNATLAGIARSIVVIVEDEYVSKVEIGQNSGGSSSPTSTAPSSWTPLTKNDDYTTQNTVGKRWVGSMSGTPPNTKTGIYVRITAEDGTQQVYRYVQHYSTSGGGSSAYRGEATSLSIGGTAVITSNSVQSPHSKGTFAGWWNKTVAPNFEPGSVTIPASAVTNGNVTLSAVFNNGDGLSVQYAKVSEWPLKENNVVTFSAVTSGMTLSNATVSDVKNGDYIIIRMNSKDGVYASFFTHYIIKVNIQ